MNKNKTTIVLSDIHLPFEDKPLIKAIFNLVRDIKPDEIILAGDLMDFYSISKFEKGQHRADDLQYEVDTACMFFYSLKFIEKSAKIIYIEGNHESRLKKFINGTNVKALRNLKSLQFKELLELNKYGIHYVPYAYQVNPNLIVKHGEKTGKYPARGELDKENINGISGHSHKSDVSYKHGYDQNMVWYSIGHLANKKELDKHYSQALRWNQSFAIVQSDKKSFDVEVIECGKEGFFCKLNQKFYKRIKK